MFVVSVYRLVSPAVLRCFKHYHLYSRMVLEINQSLSTAVHTSSTCLLKPVPEDSDRLSSSRTRKDLLLYLILDKAAEQFLKQKYADGLAAALSRAGICPLWLYWLYPRPEPAATCSPASASRNSVCVITRENIG